MSQQNFSAKKRFGQNFLKDENIIERIIEVIGINSNDLVLEIGPGLGALTDKLQPLCQKLILVEIDYDLVAELNNKFQACANVQIINQDILKSNLLEIIGSASETTAMPGTPVAPAVQLRVIGNLPYNISTPIIFKLLQNTSIVQDMYFMLQQEVVDRLVAMPGNKNYGRLSIMVQYYCMVRKLLTVPSDAFVPKPKVQSAFIELKPYDILPIVASNFDSFANITRVAFTKRRKTILNALKGIITLNILEKLNISPKARPEDLSVADFVNISNSIVASNNIQ